MTLNINLIHVDRITLFSLGIISNLFWNYNPKRVRTAGLSVKIILAPIYKRLHYSININHVFQQTIGQFHHLAPTRNALYECTTVFKAHVYSEIRCFELGNRCMLTRTKKLLQGFKLQANFREWVDLKVIFRLDDSFKGKYHKKIV